MTVRNTIHAFLRCSRFAVVGASRDRSKYGNRILRMYMEYGLNVVPVNPMARQVEGLPAVASLTEIDPLPQAVSLITPPSTSEQIVQEAVDLNIGHIWLQPGAESPACISICESSNVTPIYGGPCLLLVLPDWEILPDGDGPEVDSSA